MKPWKPKLVYNGILTRNVVFAQQASSAGTSHQRNSHPIGCRTRSHMGPIRFRFRILFKFLTYISSAGFIFRYIKQFINAFFDEFIYGFCAVAKNQFCFCFPCPFIFTVLFFVRRFSLCFCFFFRCLFRAVAGPLGDRLFPSLSIFVFRNSVLGRHRCGVSVSVRCLHEQNTKMFVDSRRRA